MRYWEEEFNHPVYKKERYTDVLKTLIDMINAEVGDKEKFDAYWAFNAFSERRKIDYSEYFPHFNELIDCENPHA